jgi:tetrahydromethanopterin S-methyltransferase subunit C
MTQTDPKPTPSGPARTVRRVLAEAVFVALLGAFVFGIAAELRFWEVGLVASIIIWVTGTPLLEVVRVMQSRR